MGVPRTADGLTCPVTQLWFMHKFKCTCRSSKLIPILHFRLVSVSKTFLKSGFHDEFLKMSHNWNL